MPNWIMNLSVGLGLTLSLTPFRIHIGVGSEGLKNGAQGDVLNALSTKNKHVCGHAIRQKMIIRTIRITNWEVCSRF
jgi:hypothetical protein